MYSIIMLYVFKYVFKIFKIYNVELSGLRGYCAGWWEIRLSEL